jgi:hypothetical protein
VAASIAALRAVTHDMRVPVALPVTVYVSGFAPAVTPLVVPHAASRQVSAIVPNARGVESIDLMEENIFADREFEIRPEWYKRPQISSRIRGKTAVCRSRSSLRDALQQVLQAGMLTRREPRRRKRLHDASAPVCLGEERIRTFEAEYLLEVFDRRVEMTDAIGMCACAEVVHGTVRRKSEGYG